MPIFGRLACTHLVSSQNGAREILGVNGENIAARLIRARFVPLAF
jgi:hypothetical protein